MLATCIAISEPGIVALIGERGPSGFPLVHLVPLPAFKRAVGRQVGFNRRIRAGQLSFVDHVRYDPEGTQPLAGVSVDCIGRKVLSAGPALVAGLVLSSGGSDRGTLRMMCAVFADRHDARLAAADALRVLERLDLVAYC